MPRVTVGTSGPSSSPVELHYTDQGQGRPVVLIHGWPLSGRSWEAQVPPLVEAGHRVVTYDRRGFGSSSQPWDGYDYDTFAADLNALLEHLDLTDVTLVGFSMGGGEVVRYLTNHGSARVAKAVLAGAVPPYLYKSEDNPDGGLDDATVTTFLESASSDRAAFLEFFTKQFFSAGGVQKVSEPLRQYMVQIALAASPRGTVECIKAWSYTDFRADVARVDVPLLVLHGDSDAIVPLEVSGKRVADTVPGAQLVVVEGAPHGFNASHPSKFNRALLDFLAS